MTLGGDDCTLVGSSTQIGEVLTQKRDLLRKFCGPLARLFDHVGGGAGGKSLIGKPIGLALERGLLVGKLTVQPLALGLQVHEVADGHENLRGLVDVRHRACRFGSIRAEGEIIRSGGSFYGMGLSSGPWAHTFSPSTPAAYSRRRLEAGDMVRLDIYGAVEGYLFDFGRSRVAGKPPTREQQEVLDAVRDSVHAGTELLRPGQTLGAVARRCEEVFAESAYARQYGQPRHTVGGALGHSFGLDWGPPWIVADSTVEVRSGMYFAVERRIEAPGLGGANYENNIVVTETGPEIVTPAADRYGERA